jgi:chromosomal replication initiator protein
MIVDKDLLPGINAIVENAESQLASLIGVKVRVRVDLTPDVLTKLTIQKCVCLSFGVNWLDIVGSSRQEEIKDARHVYYYLCIAWLKSTLVELGRETGMRNHTTVMHGRNRIAGLVQLGLCNIYRKVTAIESQLRSK